MLEDCPPKAPPLLNAPPPELNAPPPELKAPLPELNAPPPNPPDEPKADGPLPENAPKPVAGFTGPVPKELKAELLTAVLPNGDVDGCWEGAPKEPNMALALPVDFGSPPRDIPPRPEVSGSIESSVAEVISTEMDGVDRAGGDREVDCCWVPKPKEDVPNAEGAPANALKPNAPPVLWLAAGGETDPNALWVVGAARPPNALGEADVLACAEIAAGDGVGVAALPPIPGYDVPWV